MYTDPNAGQDTNVVVVLSPIIVSYTLYPSFLPSFVPSILPSLLISFPHSSIPIIGEIYRIPNIGERLTKIKYLENLGTEEHKNLLK